MKPKILKGNRMTQLKTDAAPRGIFVVLLVAGVLLYLLQNILIPFFLAAALTYIIGPFVTGLEKRLHGSRLIIVIGLYIVVITPLVLAGFFYGPQLLASIQTFIQTIPDSIKNFIYQLFGGEQLRLMGQTVNAEAVAQNVLAQLEGLLGTPAGVVRLTGWTVTLILGVVVTLAVLFYLLATRQPFTRLLLHVTPPEKRPQILFLAGQIDRVLGRYLRGLVLIVAYASVSAWVGLGLIFRLPYAIPLAVLTGLLELLPCVGPVVSWGLAALVAMVTAGFWKAILVVAFYGGLRLSLDNFLGPIILGRAALLNPAMVIFAFLAGGTLFGVLGLMLAVPLAATMKIIIDNRNLRPAEE
jgi:predicted PurR-regulated permease PerM